MRAEYIAQWTLISQIPPVEAPILLKGERALCAFETKGSTAIFTDRRIIVAESTAKEVEIFSVPYKNIVMWRSVTGNNTTSYELFTEAGTIKMVLKKDIDPVKFGKIIATCVLKKG